MFGLDDNADTSRLQVVAQPVRDLLSQPLLYLEVSREQVHHPRKLRQPQDAATGEVTDVGLAGKRQ